MHPLGKQAISCMSDIFNQRIWRIQGFLKMLLVQRDSPGDVTEAESDYYIFCCGLPVTNVKEAAEFILSTLEDMPEDLDRLGKMIREQVISSPCDFWHFEARQGYYSRTIENLKLLGSQILVLRKLCQQLIGRRNWIVQRRAESSQDQGRAEAFHTLLRTFDCQAFDHLREAMRSLLTYMLKLYHVSVNSANGQDSSDHHLAEIKPTQLCNSAQNKKKL